MAHIAAHLNAGVILVVTVWRYIISFFHHLHTPFPSPLPPSLISLMVSVDFKHHVYFTSTFDYTNMELSFFYSYNGILSNLGNIFRLLLPRLFA